MTYTYPENIKVFKKRRKMMFKVDPMEDARFYRERHNTKQGLCISWVDLSNKGRCMWRRRMREDEEKSEVLDDEEG